jgi:hypothetical protein
MVSFHAHVSTGEKWRLRCGVVQGGVREEARLHGARQRAGGIMVVWSTVVCGCVHGSVQEGARHGGVPCC